MNDKFIQIVEKEKQRELKLVANRKRGLPLPRTLDAEIKRLIKSIQKNLNKAMGNYYHSSRSFHLYLRVNTRKGKTNLDIGQVEVAENWRGRGVYTAIEAALIKLAWRETLRVESVLAYAFKQRFEQLADNPQSGWEREIGPDANYTLQTPQDSAKNSSTANELTNQAQITNN